METVEEIAKEVRNVPALRFPEFEREWKEKPLEDIAVRGSGHTPNKSFPEYYNGEIKWVSLVDSKSLDNGYIENTSIFISPEGLKNSSAVLHPKGSVLLSRDAGVGKSAVMKCDMAVSQHFIVWQAKEGVLSNWFLYYTLQILKPEFERIAIGNTIKTIGLPYFKKLKITIPDFLEQQKIASFLTAVDDKIQQLTKKKALLEQYKKGAMQQIFSQQIRFKDDNGQDFPEWEEKILGDVLDFYSTNSFSRSLLNYEGGFVKNIHYGDIHTTFKSNFDITKELVPFINEDVDLKKVFESSYCKVGDLVIADASEDYKDIGKAIEIINLNNEKILAGLHTYIARDNKGIFAPGFKGYLMQSRRVRLQAMTMATGVSVLGLSKGNIAKIEVALPVLAEQAKIASFLTAIDDKINLVTKQLEQARQFKKGLLQQMFV
jgi:type I restriction enzyme S subunit